MPSPHRRSSRPTTPLRRIERGSLSALSQSRNSASGHASDTPLELLDIGFSELADAFSDLNANMQQIVGLGQDISRFNESFASFLYGLNVNAFCVDFPEAPVPESFKRAAERHASTWQQDYRTAISKTGGSDNTFMTTDDSFVERPPPRQSLSSTGATQTPANKRGGSSARGRGSTTARARGTTRAAAGGR